jgi:hypothetical protein
MLSILGIVAIIVIAIQVYKSAAGTERNAAGWTFVSVAVGVGIQFVFPVLIGVLLAVYLLMTGTPQNQLQSGLFGVMAIIEIVGIVLSIAAMFLVAKHVSKIKDEETNVEAPPPPPRFEQSGL